MMKRIRSRLIRSRAAGDESGFTLMELLIAMLLFGVVIAVASNLYVSTTRSLNVAQNVNQNTRQASNVINESARMIRAATPNPVSGQATSAPAFVSATNESVLLYAYVNLTGSTQQPIMVQLSLNARRQIVETIWPSTALAGGYWQFPATTTTPTVTRILGGIIGPKSATTPWLFTYLDNTGTPIATSSNVLSTGAIPAATLASIASVQITVTAQTSLSDATNSVTLENTVGLSNI